MTGLEQTYLEKLEIIKKFAGNGMRISHNPHFAYDLFDRIHHEAETAQLSCLEKINEKKTSSTKNRG